MNTKTAATIALLAILCVTACAAGPNPAQSTADAAGALAGFWLGLWHGMIAPIAFIISLFNDGVHLYEVHNNGGWYNFGFVLGSGILFGSSKVSDHRKQGQVAR